MISKKALCDMRLPLNLFERIQDDSANYESRRGEQLWPGAEN